MEDATFTFNTNHWSILSSCFPIGGSVAEAFTNAFVSNKVIEARAQMEECLKCLCTAGRIMCEAPATRNKTCQSVVGML